MLAVTQSTPTHWVDRLASKPLGKFQFLLRRSKKPGKWPLLPFSSAQLFFSRLQSHFGWHSSSEVNWFIVITIVFQVGNQFCHFWTKEWRGDNKTKQTQTTQHTKTQTFSFRFVCCNICFCSTETAEICKMFTREASIRWKRHESQKPPWYYACFVQNQRRSNLMSFGFFVVFVFYLVSYCQNATSQKTKTAVCISHGFHIL